MSKQPKTLEQRLAEIEQRLLDLEDRATKPTPAAAPKPRIERHYPRKIHQQGRDALDAALLSLRPSETMPLVTITSVIAAAHPHAPRWVPPAPRGDFNESVRAHFAERRGIDVAWSAEPCFSWDQDGKQENGGAS